MKDSNNNNQANNEARVSDATYSQQNKVKSSNTNRTSDIYERFLNRVENIDGDRDVAHSNIESSKTALESSVKIKKSSSYEPLNDDELRFFTSPEEAINAEETTSTDVDFNDDFDDKKEKVASVATHRLNEKKEDAVLSAHEEYENSYANTHANNHASYNSEADLATSEPQVDLKAKDASAQQTKSTSSSKLLIIGIVSGLLLSAAIMLLLNKTGFLSNSADSSKTTSASTPTAKSEQPVAINTNTVANTEAQVLAEPQAAEQNLSRNEGNAAANPSEVPVAQQPAKDSNSNIAADPAITVEDFKEEAQNTLYRETND